MGIIFKKEAMPAQLLFVYGTLRPAFGRPMALWFGTVARHKGKGSAKGALYRIADYPGFVPGPNGVVAGDVFELPDPTPVLAKLDIYEECSPDFPPPHEYRREMLAVDMPDGPVQAWVYVYARPTDGQERLENGNLSA